MRYRLNIHFMLKIILFANHVSPEAFFFIIYYCVRARMRVLYYINIYINFHINFTRATIDLTAFLCYNYIEIYRRRCEYGDFQTQKTDGFIACVAFVRFSAAFAPS